MGSLTSEAHCQVGCYGLTWLWAIDVQNESLAVEVFQMVLEYRDTEETVNHCYAYPNIALPLVVND